MDVQYLRLCLQGVVAWGIAGALLTTFKTRPKEAQKEKKYSVEKPIDRIIYKRLRGKQMQGHQRCYSASRIAGYTGGKTVLSLEKGTYLMSVPII